MSSKIITVPSDNPHNYCRLCFSDRNLVELCPSAAEPQLYLLDQILQCTGIQINPAEEFPCSICWRCAVALEDFQIFRQRSLKHDAIVREKYANTFEIRSVGEQESAEWMLASSIIDNCDEKPKDAENGICTTEIQHSVFTPELLSNLDSMEDDALASNSTIASKDDDESKGPRSFTCHLCRTEFSTQPSLFAHFKEQHSDRGRPHKCNVCPATFKRKNHLEDHLAAHSGEMRYSCTDCGSHYAKSKSLIRHRQQFHSALFFKPTRDNSVGGQFKCAYCPKSFKHRPSLNFHVKSHYEMLPYICEICNARFENKKGLQVHKGKYHPMEAVRKHPPQKEIFKCFHCPRIFEQRQYLTQHVKYMHPVPTEGNEDESPSAEQQLEAHKKEGVEHEDREIQPVTIKFEAEDSDLLDDMGIEMS